jgi:regulator of replication initiation timing
LRGELRESKSRQKEVSDLERLNNLLRLKVEEATRWETSNQELIKNSENLQNNLEATLRENSSLKTQLQRLTAENGTLIEQLNEYKNKVQQILKEFERLQQMLEAFRRENGDLKRESYELKAQLTGGNLREKVLHVGCRTRSCWRRSSG